MRVAAGWWRRNRKPMSGCESFCHSECAALECSHLQTLQHTEVQAELSCHRVQLPAWPHEDTSPGQQHASEMHLGCPRARKSKTDKALPSVAVASSSKETQAFLCCQLDSTCWFGTVAQGIRHDIPAGSQYKPLSPEGPCWQLIAVKYTWRAFLLAERSCNVCTGVESAAAHHSSQHC